MKASVAYAYDGLVRLTAIEVDTAFAGLLYWARSALNGGAWVPCMLSLVEGQVELVSERGLELRGAASDLVIDITGLSNLRVVSSGGTFVLSGVGGRAVPLPLPSLEARLKSFRESHAQGPKVSLVDPVTQWRNLLVAAGAQSGGRSRSWLPQLWGISVGVFVASMVALGILIANLAAR